MKNSGRLISVKEQRGEWYEIWEVGDSRSPSPVTILVSNDIPTLIVKVFTAVVTRCHKEVPIGASDVPAAAVSSSTSISGAGESTVDCPGSVATAQYDTVRPAPQWFLYELADKPRRGYEEEEAELLRELMKELDEKYGPVNPA